MYWQDPVSLLALHRADHRELVADAQYARSHRAHRTVRLQLQLRLRLRRLVRLAYYRSVRRMRAARSAPAVSSRVAP